MQELARQLRLKEFRNVAREKAFIQGSNRMVVDVYGEKNGIMFFEIEERRRAPVQNVAKLIRWVHRSRGSERVTMIHVFSREFYRRSANRDEEHLARFIGMVGHKFLNGRFDYIPLSVQMVGHRNKRTAGQQAAETAKLIVEHVSSLFAA